MFKANKNTSEFTAAYNFEYAKKNKRNLNLSSYIIIKEKYVYWHQNS